MRISHKTAMTAAGTVWLCGGFALMRKGLTLLAHMESSNTALPLAERVAAFAGDMQTAAVALIAGSLALGYLKGRTAMQRVVVRMCQRMSAQPDPAPILSLFGWGWIALIAGGAVVSGLVNRLGLPADVRGLIDVAIGAALIQGASAYYRYGLLAVENR